MKRVATKGAWVTALALVCASATASPNGPDAARSASAVKPGSGVPHAAAPPPGRPTIELSRMRRGPTFSVREQYAERAAHGCTYAVLVRGRLEQWLPRIDVGGVSRELGPDLVYVPDLALSARLACQGVRPRRTDPATLRGTPLTEPQLERALEAYARVIDATPTRTCTLEPDFVVANGSVAVTALAQRCSHLRAPPGAGLSQRRERAPR